MRITVLAGGTSTERDISIVTGTKVTQALRSRGHKVAMVDVFCGIENREETGTEECFEELSGMEAEAAAAYMHTFDDRLDRMKTYRVENRLGFFGPRVLDLCQHADIVFMALHGSNGEDGKIQAAFELMGIPFTGSNYLGSALAMDKEVTKQLFRENHVPTPWGIVLHKGDVLVSAAENEVGLPCVVKPACGGSSVGVSVVHTQAEYEKAVDEGFNYEDVLIVERYIKGREFSVGIVDGMAYPVIEIAPISGFYDYHNKYAAGSTVETCPANISREVRDRIQEAAVRAYRALRVDSYGRVDVMMDAQDNVYCLEVNTLPGMTPTSLLPQEAAALGMDFAGLCERLIEVSLDRS